jgi:aspartyl-tRNA(Asn)/glutamyl-tRNA(Gln) amidotransferase subunit B
MPVLNREAVVLAVRAALGLGCEIQLHSAFARKHYFYPDLPKGYQITQTDRPLGKGGEVQLPGDAERGLPNRTVRIERVHVEEDAGKSVHRAGVGLVDLNRAGVPLIEIVTAPDLTSGQDAARCLAEVRAVLMAVAACDGNMEEGSLRCDVNVSLRRAGEAPGTRVEVKNVNSFRFVRRAVDFEVERQRRALEAGRAVVRETRGWDEREGRTFAQRTKEDSDDYRYFAEPDLPPLVLTSWWVQAQRDGLPELPAQRRRRFIEMGVTADAAVVLSSQEWVARLFDRVVEGGIDARAAASFLLTEVLRDTGGRALSSPMEVWQVVEILGLVRDGAISGKQAKDLTGIVRGSGASPRDVVAARGMHRVADEDVVREICERVVGSHPGQVKAYRKGKTGVLGFFMGAVMRETGGSADPRMTDEILRGLLAAEDEPDSDRPLDRGPACGKR